MAFSLLGFIHLSYRIPNKEILSVFGTGSIYYLGSDNEATSPLLLLFTTSILYWSIRSRNCLSIIGIIIPVFTAFYSKCGTGMIVFLLFLSGNITALIPGTRGITRKLCSSKTVLIVLVTYYLILWGLIAARFSSLSVWISNITGKNAITFTNRDVIWMEAIRIIKNYPLFGIGYGEGAGGNGVFANGFYRGAHNTILQWGVNGGIITILFFAIILYVVMKSIDRLSFPLNYYLYLCCLMFLIAMSMENYSNGLHFLPTLAIIYYAVNNKDMAKSKYEF